MSDPAGESAVQLAPMWFSATEPMVDRLRAVVLEDASLRAAFLYRRAVADSAGDITAESLVPTVGLLAYSGTPSATTVGRVRRAVGMIHGSVPTIVAIDREALGAVVAVAHPVGAGGEVERAMVGYISAPESEPAPGRRPKVAPALRLGLLAHRRHRSRTRGHAGPVARRDPTRSIAASCSSKLSMGHSAFMMIKRWEPTRPRLLRL